MGDASAHAKMLALRESIGCTLRFEWKGKKIIATARSHELVTRGKDDWNWNGNELGTAVLEAHRDAVEAKLRREAEKEES